jgi:hypothetical protein
MERIKNSIASIIAVYISYSAINAFLGTFSINSSLFIFLICIFVFFPCLYFLFRKKIEINKVFSDKEKFDIKNENSEIYTHDIRYAEIESKWFYWKEYLPSFFIGLAAIGTVGVLFLYGILAIFHKYAAPFPKYKEIQVTAIKSQCSSKTDTVQICDLLVKTKDGTLTIKTPVNTAKNITDGNRYVIEYKHSFIGESISRYRQL